MFQFKRIKKKDLPLILKWRTSERVASMMLTQVSVEGHQQWYEEKARRGPYWLIYHQDKPIGLISFSPPDMWGFYIGEDDHVALGGLVPPYFYNHIFNEVDYLYAVVKKGNPVLKLHEMHGYQHIASPGDVVCLRLNKGDWIKKERFKHFLACFE